jgi:hypothetical protein
MTTLSYYMATDCTEVRKQMTIFNVYGSWEPYNAVPKQSLLDWIDKEIVENFCCYRIYLKHSSVYTIFNFKYIISPCQWQWPHSLRHELSLPARMLGSRVWIPLKACLSVCVYSVCVGNGLLILPTVLWLRNWSETKCITDTLCSKFGATWERERGR